MHFSPLFLLFIEALELGRNKLNGTVPTEIANLTNLENFFVDMNNLEGPFPEIIFELTKLKQLNVTGNSFSGTIPSAIGMMGSKLTTRQRKYVALGDNRFDGTIPPELANITDLSEYPTLLCDCTLRAGTGDVTLFLFLGQVPQMCVLTIFLISNSIICGHSFPRKKCRRARPARK